MSPGAEAGVPVGTGDTLGGTCWSTMVAACFRRATDPAPETGGGEEAVQALSANERKREEVRKPLSGRGAWKAGSEVAVEKVIVPRCWRRPECRGWDAVWE